MTLSVSESKTGAIIRGEVQFGQVLLVNFEEAYNIVHRDINKIQEWAPSLASVSILDNRFEAWEVGARRRVVVAKSPYKDLVLREILSEKTKSQSRAHVTFTYCPLEGEERSFSNLKLDSFQKFAKCMAQKGPLGVPELPNISERLFEGSSAQVVASNQGATTPSNKYSSEVVMVEPIGSKHFTGAEAGGFAPRGSRPVSEQPQSTPTSQTAPGDAPMAPLTSEEPTLLSMRTTYSFHQLSGGIATTGKAPALGATAGELRSYMEVLVEYTLSCETPGELDERILYDHTVLREFLEKFWVREVSESFANYAHAQAYHLTDGANPLKGPSIGYGSIALKSSAAAASASSRPNVLGGPSDARLNSVADKLGLRFAEEQAQYDVVVSQLAAKSKTAEDDAVADTVLKLLGSWERVTGELKRSQEMVERMAHELDAAKLITNAATGFNAASERGRVVYDFEQNKLL
eukprot:GILI01004325.1.p1 GENE.GILI01004325.1~~GILI01004325.1.p1  ORF type:complete len:462 (-),score=92.21 GILI01004325.1:88-1473(-)